mgnify:CR=1 FL=1
MPIPQSLTALSLTTVVPCTTLDAAGIVGVQIQPTDGNIYVGDLAVTTSTGVLVPSGSAYTVRTKHPSKWGVVSASGTVNVRVTLLKGN